MNRNILGLAIAVAMTAKAHGVDGVRQNFIRKPREVRREVAEQDSIDQPHQGFKESLRRSNKKKYRELLDVERQDRGVTFPAQQKPGDTE